MTTGFCCVVSRLAASGCDCSCADRRGHCGVGVPVPGETLQNCFAGNRVVFQQQARIDVGLYGMSNAADTSQLACGDATFCPAALQQSSEVHACRLIGMHGMLQTVGNLDVLYDVVFSSCAMPSVCSRRKKQLVVAAVPTEACITHCTPRRCQQGV